MRLDVRAIDVLRRRQSTQSSCSLSVMPRPLNLRAIEPKEPLMLFQTIMQTSLRKLRAKLHLSPRPVVTSNEPAPKHGLWLFIAVVLAALALAVVLSRFF